MPQVINLHGKTSHFEDTRSTGKHSNNCSSLFLWTLFRRTTFLLQNHKDGILICLFGRLQKYGINLNHPIRQHFWSHAIFRTPGHESITVWLKFNTETIYYSSSEKLWQHFLHRPYSPWMTKQFWWSFLLKNIHN